MTMEERLARMESRQITISDETRDAINGKVVLVIDDVNVTGSHEETLRKMFAKTNVLRHVFCYLYAFNKTMAIKEPHMEDRFNHAAVKSVVDLVPFFKGGCDNQHEVMINARVLKFILNTEGETAEEKVSKLLELKTFLLQLDDATLLKLYAAATSADGYFRKQKFVDGFHILADILVSRRLIEITAVHKVKNNTVFKFISFDETGNLINMVTGEKENVLGHRYSLMKFGCVEQIRWFGTEMANAFIRRLSDPADHLIKLFEQAKATEAQVVMISPGSRNVESAQNFVFEVTLAKINVYLAMQNLPTIVMLKLTRFTSGIANYAELSLADRCIQERQQSASQYIMPSKEFFDLGLYVIFADDVRITGSAADRAENACRARGAHSFSSMYCLVVDPKVTLDDASIENFLNKIVIKGNLSHEVTMILNQPGFRPVQRMMRLILGEANRQELRSYLQTLVCNDSIMKIYEAGLGNNFHQDERYADSIPILREILEERGYIDEYGLTK